MTTLSNTKKDPKRNKKYVYWIEKESGGIGEYYSLKDARKILEKIKEITSIDNWEIKRKEAMSCPTCKVLTDAENIKSFGECLHCEKLRNNY